MKIDRWHKCPKRRFRSKYKFRPLIKYIPSRYMNLADWQIKNRELVLDFKNGCITDEHKELILNAIKRIIKEGDPHEWVVCFVPASTGERHFERYNEIAMCIETTIGCTANPMLIMREYNQEPIHRVGVKEQMDDIKLDSQFDYRKHFIVMDDLITTGLSFRTVGDLLTERGALSVQGVIFGMTIHPNLPTKRCRKKKVH